MLEGWRPFRISSTGAGTRGVRGAKGPVQDLRVRSGGTIAAVPVHRNPSFSAATSAGAGHHLRRVLRRGIVNRRCASNRAVSRRAAKTQTGGDAGRCLLHRMIIPFILPVPVPSVSSDPRPSARTAKIRGPLVVLSRTNEFVREWGARNGGIIPCKYLPNHRL